jgi:hypothetical protein
VPVAGHETTANVAGSLAAPNSAAADKNGADQRNESFKSLATYQCRSLLAASLGLFFLRFADSLISFPALIFQLNVFDSDRSADLGVRAPDRSAETATALNVIA